MRKKPLRNLLWFDSFKSKPDLLFTDSNGNPLYNERDNKTSLGTTSFFLTKWSCTSEICRKYRGGGAGYTGYTAAYPDFGGPELRHIGK